MLGTSTTSQRLPTRESHSLPEHLTDTTIKYLRWIRRDAGRATIGFVTSVSFSDRVKKILPSAQTFMVFYIEESLLQFCREYSNYINIGQKYQALYVRSYIVSRRNIFRHKCSQNICARRTLTL